MSQINEQAIYQEILRLHGIHFLVMDASLRIQNYSPGIIQLASHPVKQLRGTPVSELFDELIGLEADLEQVKQGLLPFLTIDKVLRHLEGKEKYITFTISRLGEYLLLIIADVTAESRLEQRITQQRNEMTLLSRQLAATRARLDELLRRYLPESVAEQLINNPEASRLGGKRQEVTVLFADLRGFTSWAEELEPELALHLLNEKLRVAVEAIQAHGGILDKYMGDAVMGIFNAPAPDADHARHALAAAWQITQSLSDKGTLQFSIGVNTGTAVVGNIGTQQAMNYTAIGDAVNQAKRLQEMAAGGQIYFSHATYMQVANAVRVRPLGELKLRGRKTPTPVYELLGWQ